MVDKDSIDREVLAHELEDIGYRLTPEEVCERQWWGGIMAMLTIT